MGCHTWFSVPYETDKSNILELAQKNLDNWNTTPSNKRMYQYAIDNELETPVGELACLHDGYKAINWVLYMDVEDWSLKEYNRLNGTNYKSKYDKEVYDIIPLEHYSDEPRIGNYPEIIIRSYDEMVKVIEDGLDGEEWDKETEKFVMKKAQFYYEEGRKPKFMAGIKRFFELHPDGIITFG